MDTHIISVTNVHDVVGIKISQRKITSPDSGRTFWVTDIIAILSDKSAPGREGDFNTEDCSPIGAALCLFSSERLEMHQAEIEENL